MAQSRSTGHSGSAKRKSTAASGSSRQKTTAKRTAPSSAARKSSPAPQKTSAQSKSQPAKSSAAERAKQQQQQQLTSVAAQNNQLWSVLLFATGILVLLIAVIPGTKAWGALHNLLLGLFGISILLVPAVFIYTASLVGQDKSKQASRRALWGVLLTVFCSGFIQIFFGKTVWSDGFAMTIKYLYEEGKSFRGGGLLSGIVAWPLIALFAEIGAKIVIILAIFVFIMLLTNLGVAELFAILTAPFRWIWRCIAKIATHGVFFYDEDSDAVYDADIEDEPEYDEEWDDEEDEEDLHFFPALPRRTRPLIQKPLKKQKQPEILPDGNQLELMSDMFDNIDVDIPILDTDPTLPAEHTNRLSQDARTDAAFDLRMSEDEEAELQRMIDNAEGKSPEHHSLSSNLLPWAEDPDLDAADESIYDEAEAAPYIAPPLSLLSHIDNNSNSAEKSAELREKSTLLKETLASFGVEVRIVGMRRGPSVTRYEIQPAAGVKISRITALADDIGMNLGGEKVRIEAPIPGKPAVGVEVANNTKDMVPIRDILESPEFQESKSKLTFAVGKDIDGNVILGDIAKMPHMIIAGTTGSGKSVCTNSIIMSVLYHASPDEVRMVLIDPKVVEFAPYDGIPHLLIPVVTNPQKATGALNWAVIEMERRYGLCAQYGVRDLKGYNALAERNPELKKLPQILIIIDEFADLMMSASKEVETAVIRIAQKARAAGIHLIIATQRPTVDVITGLIKANVPSRIGMSVKSAQDSRIILDCSGAETLLGNGDLLFYPNGWREPKRVQGCFCSDSEVEAVTSFLKNNGSSEYDHDIIEAVEQNIPTAKSDKPMGAEDNAELNGDEELMIRAAEYAVDAGQLATTLLQRRLRLGYARAARIMDALEERGVISPAEGSKPRKVLISPQELTEWKLRIASKGAKFEE